MGGDGRCVSQGVGCRTLPGPDPCRLGADSAGLTAGRAAAKRGTGSRSPGSCRKLGILLKRLKRRNRHGRKGLGVALLKVAGQVLSEPSIAMQVKLAATLHVEHLHGSLQC